MPFFVSLKDEGYVGKTIPNKLVMAMAFAKPVIAVLEGDGRAELSNAEGGIFATQQDSKSLLPLSNHLKLFQKMKEKGW